MFERFVSVKMDGFLAAYQYSTISVRTKEKRQEKLRARLFILSCHLPLSCALVEATLR